jgi:arginine decarboxylase
MVGAYQDTLGDIHNLFGDTDAVNVRLTESGHALERTRRGDTTDVMLDYVGYRLSDLRERYAQMVAAVDISAAEAASLRAALEAGLTGYTYLAE